MDGKGFIPLCFGAASHSPRERWGFRSIGSHTRVAHQLMLAACGLMHEIGDYEPNDRCDHGQVPRGGKLAQSIGDDIVECASVKGAPYQQLRKQQRQQERGEPEQQKGRTQDDWPGCARRVRRLGTFHFMLPGPCARHPSFRLLRSQLMVRSPQQARWCARLRTSPAAPSSRPFVRFPRGWRTPADRSPSTEQTARPGSSRAWHCIPPPHC